MPVHLVLSPKREGLRRFCFNHVDGRDGMKTLVAKTLALAEEMVKVGDDPDATDATPIFRLPNFSNKIWNGGSYLRHLPQFCYENLVMNCIVRHLNSSSLGSAP